MQTRARLAALLRARGRARRAAARGAVAAGMFVLAATLLAALPTVAAAAWTPITSPGANVVVNPITDMTWDGSKLWAVWGDDAYDVDVASWDGTSWSAIAQPGTGASSNKMPSITWDGSKLWAAWNDDSGTVQVASWNGSSWTGVVSPGTAGGGFTTPDLEMIGATLYVAYQDASRNVQVKSWNGAAWTAVASPGGGGANNSYPSLGWDGSRMWVAYNDAANTAQVKYYNAGVWTAITNFGSGGINTLPSIGFVGSRLYAMREDASHTILFQWWNGQSWTAAPTLGSAQTSWAYSTVLWNGTSFWDARTADPDTINVAFETDSAPAAPTAPAQYLADGTTPIAWGGWTSAGASSNLVLKQTMSDADAGEQLTPWVEIQPNATPFSATCGQYSAGTTFIGSPVSAPVSGGQVTGSVTVTGLANNQSYHWRACTVDQWGFPSAWVTPGNSPDLRVDTTVPTSALSSPANGATVTQAPLLTATYTDAAPSSPGQLNFQVCSDAACTTVVRSGSTSLGIASGSTGSWTPAALALGTWYWRTQPVDSAGNTGVWTATRSFIAAASINVSGTAYDNETGTVWSGCDGFTANIAVSVDGAAIQSGTCSPVNGAWAVGVNVVLADRPVVAYYNGAATSGATYTRNADTSSNIVGLGIVKDRVWTRSESTSPMDSASINVYDNTQDPDIPAQSNGMDLTIAGASRELHVGAGSSFQSGGNVTTPRLHVAGRYVAWPTETLTITGAGSGACTSASPRPLCVEAGGSFATMDGQVTRFTSTSDLEVDPTTYRRLELRPGGAGSPTYTLGTSSGGTLQAKALAVGDGTNAVTVSTAGWNTPVTVFGDLTVSANATYLGAGTGTTTVDGSVTGAGTITATGSMLDHRVAGVGETFGTTAGAANWSIGNLRVDDYAPAAWNVTGMVTFNNSGGNDRIQAITHDSAGNIYACGWLTGATGEDMVVRRYTPAGALDTGWASGTGMVTYNSAGVLNDECWDVAVDAAGRLYMAGTAKVGDASGSDIVVRRYTTAGVLDTSWASGTGMVTYNSGVNQTDSMSQLVLDPQGALYVTGRQQSNGTDWVILKYTRTGVLDAGWNGTGLVTWNSGGAVEDQLTGAALQPDGKLLVAGYAGAVGAYDWKVRRYTTAGALDATWAGGGTLTYAPSAWNDIPGFKTVLIDTTGNIYVGGYISTSGTNQDLVVRKYDSTGTIIAGWGVGGMVTYNSGANTLDAAYQMSLDADGRLVVPGYQQTNGYDWVVLRYTTAGQLDTTFGNGSGFVNYNSGGVSTDSPRGSFIDASGNIVVGGYQATNGGDWAIRTYDPGGNLEDGTAGIAGSSVPPAGGTGSISIGTQLVVGQASDPATTTLALETNDRTVDVNGSLSISSKGIVNASSTTDLTIAKDFTNNGSFLPNAGRVVFDTTATSTLLYAAPTNFKAFMVTTPGKALRFDNLHQTNISGAFAISGGSCANPVSMFSDVPGQAFEINPIGLTVVNYAYIGDSTAVFPSTANSSYGATGNTGWTINGGACAPVFGQNVDDSNAQSGTANPSTITQFGHHYSWINKSGSAKDRQRVQVANDNLNNIIALWHADNSVNDSSGNGLNLTATPAAAYDAAGKFSQAFQFNGARRYDVASNPLFNATQYTVDLWFKSTTVPGTCSTLISRDIGNNGTNRQFGFEISNGCTAGGNLKASATVGGVYYQALTPYAPLLDGNWHYLAATTDTTTLKLYVDGALKNTVAIPGAVDQTNTLVRLGQSSAGTEGFTGSIDEVRMLNRALSATEILDYYNTNLPHNTIMWDSDTTDTGVPLAASCNDMTRCSDIVYGATGAPIALNYNGARYYARAKFRLGAGAWTAWSDWDWFETMPALTLSVPTGTSASLGASLPNTDATATSTVTVFTNNATGYTLTATASSDTKPLAAGALGIGPWSGTPATPTTWAQGTAGGFGISVLSATSGKDTARWGTGTTQTSFGTLKYAGPLLSTPTQLQATAAYSPASDDVVVTYRNDISNAQQPGAYTGVVTYTATANP